MSKRGIVLYLHVHQPWRIRDYSVFDTAHAHDYFNDLSETDRNNRKVLEKVAEKSYRPMNEALLRMLHEHAEFKVSLSITGTFIEQCEQWAPDILESFKKLVDTGRVEIVGETYNHSLAFFYSREEFQRQVDMHRQKIEKVFGVTPTSFRNTELSYNDELGRWADEQGYAAVLSEGWDPILEWRSPNHVYRPLGANDTKLLTKNYRLSDDVAFRFSNRAWQQWPLTADTYASWLDSAGNDGPLINLFMDYETFGEHQWADTGIFTFFEQLIGMWTQRDDATFYTVSEAAQAFEAKDELSMKHTVTWADSERDLTAWLGNSMQQEAMKYLYDMEQDIMRTSDLQLIADWRNLQTSDHVYYMCTKWFSDGDVHAYFSPYDSPFDAFLYFMNTIRDMRYRLMAYHQTGGGHG
jgi:alpha-amylase